MVCTNKKRGFTLVEMLIALAVMSATVAFIGVIAGAVKLTRDSAYESAAFRIAAGKLSELRALGYAALPAEGAFSDPALAALPQGAASTSIADWNAATKRVSAGVSWAGADGSPRVVSLTTLITESGGL